MDIAPLHEVDKFLSDLDVKIAQAYFQFRSLVAKVVQKTCRDDAAFFEGLPQESSHWLEPKHAKKFWSTLRRHMPKFRSFETGEDLLIFSCIFVFYFFWA